MITIRFRQNVFCFGIAAALTAASHARVQAAVSILLSAPPGTSQPVGTPVQWTASNAANDGKILWYRWSVVQNGTTTMFRDFNGTATITWAPMQEGPYTLTVAARNSANIADVTSASASYAATSLLGPGGSPTVTPTINPLVAIYSATCASGSMRVFFAPSPTPVTSYLWAPYQPCVLGHSINFQIAGMRESTTYSLVHSISDAGGFTAGPRLQFTTGTIPTSVKQVLPTATISPIGVSTAAAKVILNSVLGRASLPAAFDSSGNVIWYNYPPPPGAVNQLMRPLIGGTMILAQGDVIEEIDLLGNIIHETNITRMSEQLSSSPFNIIHNSGTNQLGDNRIADFNHEGIRLPGGYTATLSVMEQIVDQGNGPVDALGDLILVLDPNFQLVWAWNPFTHLDVKRKATQNDVCASFQVGCPLLKLTPPGTAANDWLHANALFRTSDGNLLLSMRNQDWVIKVDYGDGAGTGDILWRFGNGGDFRLTGGTWFSHQHDASLRGDQLLLFDNANGEQQQLGVSRGLLWTIDPGLKTAQPAEDARMNYFSPVVGSAKILSNGDMYFLAGFVNNTFSQAIEFLPTSPLATPLVTYTFSSPSYRSFRMQDLYTP